MAPWLLLSSLIAHRSLRLRLLSSSCQFQIGFRVKCILGRHSPIINGECFRLGRAPLLRNHLSATSLPLKGHGQENSLCRSSNGRQPHLHCAPSYCSCFSLRTSNGVLGSLPGHTSSDSTVTVRFGSVRFAPCWRHSLQPSFRLLSHLQCGCR
jgi:hypothetical protein